MSGGAVSGRSEASRAGGKRRDGSGHGHGGSGHGHRGSGQADGGGNGGGDGNGDGDGDGDAVFARLVERVRAEPLAIADTAALARAAGLTRTAVRSLVREHAHLTPENWLERERVRFACRLLGESRDEITGVAQAAGFADEAAFRDTFRATMCIAPEAYRALRNASRFSLRLPVPYRAVEVLAYHGRDPESPCERVTGERIFKALATDAGSFVLEIVLGRGEAACVLHHERPLGPRAAHIAHGAALRMLGLTSEVAGFEARAARDARMRTLLARRPGLRVPLVATPFDGLCWAIIGQQINVPFASALRRELLDLAGERVREFRAHPSPERVATLEPDDLRKRRFSRAKAEYLIGAARAVVAGRFAPDAMHEGSAVAAERSLTSVRGIGTWTARYMLLRGVGFADCAPAGDVALAAALAKLHRAQERPGPKQVETLMQRYAPHRSLATCHLWASLRD